MELDIRGFTASQGWATNCCRRNSLKMRRRAGEGEDANEASAELKMHGIPLILRELGARPEDVFNADETGIIFAAQPQRTLAPESVRGTKKDMDRLTLLLCCNVTGTERLKPVMCRKMARQRAWGAVQRSGSWHPEPFVRWEKTKKAWMTKELFNLWLPDVQLQFAAENRRIFLILDNCSAHHIEDERATATTIHGIKVSHLQHGWCTRVVHETSE